MSKNQTPGTIKPPKPFFIKAADSQFLGSNEPLWESQPGPEDRTASLGRAFTWYGYFFKKPDAKDFVVDWLIRTGDPEKSQAIRAVSDKHVIQTLGWLCRMATMGLVLTEKELEFIQHELAVILDMSTEADDALNENGESTETQATNTIQDRIRKKVSECAGEIEGLFDDFTLSQEKFDQKWSVMPLLRQYNIVPHMTNTIIDRWASKVTELENAGSKKDPDLAEAYGFLGKTQLKNWIKFAEQVIADVKSYAQVKKSERKPKARKAVTPEKIVKRFKYLKEFTELSLVSLSPTKLLGSSESWMYDTKKRKLVRLVADAHSTGISIKGSSIVGFDPTQSVVKTLRNPVNSSKSLWGTGNRVFASSSKISKQLKQRSMVGATRI